MEEAAKEQKSIAERVQMLLYRTSEEFYDFETDPNALHKPAGVVPRTTGQGTLRHLLRLCAREVKPMQGENKQLTEHAF